jgi:antitoxin HicB
MFTASYPASFLPEDNGKGFHVRFPDLPEALTEGDDIEDTFAQAADCLAEAIAGRIARADEIPPPSKPKRGQHVISVPLYLAPKLALYLTVRERQHETKHEKIQAAITALGKRIVVTFEDAA